MWEKLTNKKAPYKDLMIRNGNWHSKKGQWVIACLELIRSKVQQLETDYIIHAGKFGYWFFEPKSTVLTQGAKQE